MTYDHISSCKYSITFNGVLYNRSILAVAYKSEKKGFPVSCEISRESAAHTHRFLPPTALRSLSPQEKRAPTVAFPCPPLNKNGASVRTCHCAAVSDIILQTNSEEVRTVAMRAVHC